jgi:hypothetical protein
MDSQPIQQLACEPLTQLPARQAWPRWLVVFSWAVIGAAVAFYFLLKPIYPMDLMYIRGILLGDSEDVIALAVGIDAFMWIRTRRRSDGKLLSDFALLSLLLTILNPLGVRFVVSHIPMLPQHFRVIYLFPIIRSFIAGGLALFTGVVGLIAVKRNGRQFYGTVHAWLGIVGGSLYLIIWVGLYIAWAKSIRGWDH